MARHPVRNAAGPAQGAGSVDNPNPELGKNATQVERAGAFDLEERRLPRGGSFGVLPEAVQGISLGPPQARPAALPSGAKRAREWRLLADAKVVYNGQVFQGRAGKVFSDHAYDIAQILRQGLPLEEIAQPEPESERGTRISTEFPETEPQASEVST
jgi:hypothetical protein